MTFENTVAFEELFEIPLRNGLTKPKAVRGSGIRMVNMGELFANGRLINTPMERVPTTNAEFEKSKLMSGDLLFARQSLVLSGAGKCSIFLKDEEDVVFESHLIRCRLNKQKANPYFYYFYFSSWQGRSVIESITEQVAVAGIRGSDLAKVEVTCPPLKDQKAIAHILGTLDEKIELNRKTNETLEGIAKALFRSWFVDFDPVRAKAEGRLAGLPDEISELFPDSFEESELGEIPNTWKFGDLNDLANLNPESWSAKNHPSKLVYVDLSGTKNGKIEETVAYEWSDAPSRARRVLREGDTIIGTVRPGNRSFSLIQRVGLTGSTGFAVIRPKQLFNTSFLYVASTSDESIDRLAHLADGGAYPAVRPDVVMETPITVPSEPIQMLFGEMTDSLLKKISVNEQELVVLGQLRDALLPRLISGELRVPDAKKMLEEVGV